MKDAINKLGELSNKYGKLHVRLYKYGWHIGIPSINIHIANQETFEEAVDNLHSTVAVAVKNKVLSIEGDGAYADTR